MDLVSIVMEPMSVCTVLVLSNLFMGSKATFSSQNHLIINNNKHLSGCVLNGSHHVTG